MDKIEIELTHRQLAILIDVMEQEVDLIQFEINNTDIPYPKKPTLQELNNKEELLNFFKEILYDNS